HDCTSETAFGAVDPFEITHSCAPCGALSLLILELFPMKKFKVSALAFVLLAAMVGIVWAVGSSSNPVQAATTPDNESCCVTGNCCCRGAGSCCDTTKRVKTDAPVARKSAGCCATGNCCCPGAGSCCSNAAKKSCCSTEGK